jgi:hypothetical protein
MSEEDLPEPVVLVPAGALLYLVSELERLKVQIASQDSRIIELAAQQDEDCDRLAHDIALDRQRISHFEDPASRDPTPTEQAHLQKIEKHLRESPRYAASFVEIRGLLGVSPGRVSQLVKKLDPQRFEVHRSARDHNARILILKRRPTL